MTDPYNWNFPSRSQTMYMSTINASNNLYSDVKFARESSFQKRDIEGALNKRQIPYEVKRQNHNYSTYVEPRPENYKAINKMSDPLKHRDIEKSYPAAVEFKTDRVVDPLMPRYKLPSCNPVSVPDPVKFQRDTLEINDIVKKQQKKPIRSPKEQAVEKSVPKKLFRTVNAVSRMDVKDINTDGLFISKRRDNPINPLNPKYTWRDNVKDKVGLSFTKNTLQQQPKSLNEQYGDIGGTKPKPAVRNFQRRSVDLSLNINDIQGAKVNSSNESRYFYAKRKDYRDVLKVNDIEKTGASSLKKGITTERKVNPLMPNYRYPS